MHVNDLYKKQVPEIVQSKLVFCLCESVKRVRKSREELSGCVQTLAAIRSAGGSWIYQTRV